MKRTGHDSILVRFATLQLQTRRHNKETAMPQDEIEQVLVVPTELFRRLGYFQGFCGNVERYLDELLRPENTSYRPRDQVEKDPGFKQLIPYMIFRHVEADGREGPFFSTPAAQAWARGGCTASGASASAGIISGHRRRKKAGHSPTKPQGDSPLFGGTRHRQSL